MNKRIKMKDENNQNIYNEGPLRLNLKKRRNKQLQPEEQKNDNSQNLKQLLNKLKNQYKQYEEVTDKLFNTPFITTNTFSQNEYEKKNEIINQTYENNNSNLKPIPFNNVINSNINQNSQNTNSNLKSIPINHLVNSNINQNYDPYKEKDEFIIEKKNNEKNDDLINTDTVKKENINILPPSNNISIKQSQNEKLKSSKLENNKFDNEFNEYDNLKFNEIKIDNNHISSNNDNDMKKNVINPNIKTNKKKEKKEKKSFEMEENNLRRKNNEIDELLDNELDFEENNLHKKSIENNNLMMNSKLEFNNEFENKNKVMKTNLKSNNTNLMFQNKNNFIINNSNQKKKSEDYALSPEKKKKRELKSDFDEDNQFNIGEKKNEFDDFDEFESERKNNDDNKDNLYYGISRVKENEEIENEKRRKMELEIEAELNKKEIEKKEEEEKKKKELEDKLKKEEEERKKKELEDKLKREEEERIKKELEDKLKREEEERKKKREEERIYEIENQFNLDDDKLKNEEIKNNMKQSKLLSSSNNDFISNSRILPPGNINENIIKESEIKEIKESEIKDIKESENNKRENDNISENNKRGNDNSNKNIKRENDNINENNKIKKDNISENNKGENFITHMSDDDNEIDLDSNLKRKIEDNKEKQRSYIENMNPQTLEKIEKVVEKIYSFDKKEPNLDEAKNFIHIESLDDDEKKFSDNFDNYEDLMKEEGNNIKNKRKEYFKKKLNYKDKPENNELFIKYISEIFPSHVKTMEENKMKMNLNELLPQFETDFNEEIFNENELLNEFNSPIGNFENIDSFIYKYHAFENYKLMSYSFSNFNYWRPSYSDGNSFYRIIIYGILEYYIITKNLDELKTLICDIIQEDYITFYRNRNIDVDIVLKILKLILTLVENEDIEEAYDILNKAFRLKNHLFDYTMIYYLRHVFFIYAEKTFNLIKGYYNDINTKIDKNDLYNFNAIEELGIEPEFYLIPLLPYLYNINFKIFYVDNTIKNPVCGTINFIDEEEENNIFMSIGYFYCNYFNLYSKINNNLQKIIQKNHFKLKKIIVNSKIKEKCKICNKKTEQQIFLEKKFIICKNCLDSHINTIIKKRIENFEKEEYNGLEYYNRPIHLQDDYYIDNSDIIQLTGENIKNKLNENKPLNCVSCDTLIDDNKYELKCGCNYCENCFIDLLKNVTDEKMCLNRFEIEHCKKENCKCGKIIDIEQMLKLYSPTQKEKNAAINRMVIYIKTLCYNCEKKIGIINKEKKIEKLEELKLIKIKKEKDQNPIEFSDTDHLCCIPCYKKQKKVKIQDKENNKEEEKEENNKNEDNNKKKDIKLKKIFCKICNKEHYQILEEEEDDAKCCSIF